MYNNRGKNDGMASSNLGITCPNHFLARYNIRYRKTFDDPNTTVIK